MWSAKELLAEDEQALQLLFYFFPREFSESRMLVHDIKRLIYLRELYNGVRDVFVSVYSTDGKIDKVTWDIDDKSGSLSVPQKIASKICYRLEEKKIPYIPIISAKKGFHIHALFEAWQSPNQQTSAYIIKTIQDKFSADLTNLDPRISGNPRALIRMPNTLHGYGYCTYLPYEFKEWTISKLIEWIKIPHVIKYKIPQGLPKITDFVNGEVKAFVDKPKPEIESSDLKFREIKLLKPLLRPCVYEAILTNAPGHYPRFSFVTELMHLGVKEPEIKRLISLLHWEDYKEHTTDLQVEQIFKHKYHPPYCEKLKTEVNCTDCGYNYWW